MGTPQALYDEEGNEAWSARYQAWGRIYRYEKKEIEQPLRFQGQYEDEETGLYYNLHRYYDPDAGRYITKDPIGLAGGFNLYTYAPASTIWIDPLGLTEEKDDSCPCAGTATVHWYDTRNRDNAYGHYSVETQVGGKTLHTHQLGAPGSTTRISNDLGNLPQPTGSHTFELPNAANARNFQESLLNKPGPPYDTKERSCVTHVGEVLRAGGLDVSPNPRQQFLFLWKFFKKFSR
jgi:RHS repeat-associated protein